MGSAFHADGPSCEIARSPNLESDDRRPERGSAGSNITNGIRQVSGRRVATSKQQNSFNLS